MLHINISSVVEFERQDFWPRINILKSRPIFEELTFIGRFFKKTSPKGFSASMCDEGNWILSNLRNFLENFWILGGIFLEFFVEKFFGRIFFVRIFLGGFFWEDFFWEDFLGGFFGRNSLQGINKELIFLSRFWGNFVSMQGRRILILRSTTQARRT